MSSEQHTLGHDFNKICMYVSCLRNLYKSFFLCNMRSIYVLFYISPVPPMFGKFGIYSLGCHLCAPQVALALDFVILATIYWGIMTSKCLYDCLILRKCAPVILWNVRGQLNIAGCATYIARSSIYG